MRAEILKQERLEELAENALVQSKNEKQDLELRLMRLRRRRMTRTVAQPVIAMVVTTTTVLSVTTASSAS